MKRRVAANRRRWMEAVAARWQEAATLNAKGQHIMRVGEVVDEGMHEEEDMRGR